MDEEFFIERRLLRIGNNLFTRRDKNLKKFGITTSQSEAILFFYQYPGSIVLDFAKHMLISHQAARNIVEKLKEKDFLKIQIDENDTRAKKIFLTDSGITLHNNLVKIGKSEGQKVLNGFSEEEKKFLFMFLDRINNNL